MCLRFIIGKSLLTLVLFLQTGLTGWAQLNPPDSLKASTSDIGQIKLFRKTLQQNNRRLDRAVADSLLLVARRLNDPAGQVVALSQIASWQRQTGQFQAAGATQTEAATLAPRLRDIRETGWAMIQVGELMRVKNNPDLDQVLSALNQSMSQTPAQVRVLGSEPTERFNRSGNEEAFPSRPQTATLPVRPLHGRNRLPTDIGGSMPPFAMQYAERWLDSLVRNRRQPTPDVVQLTEKKKIRDSSRQLSQTFAQRGDYAQAYNYYVQYTAYKDSLAAEVTARHLADLQFRQASVRKEAQIKLLTTRQQLREQEVQQQRAVVLALIGLLGLLLIFAVILIRSNRQRLRTNQQLTNKKQALEDTLSELKTTQNQLVQSEKMAALGELTAGIAHEIQNPLNFVKNFSEVSTELVDELTAEEQQAEPNPDIKTEILADLRQNLQKITQHGGRASAIVKGMLEHSRSVNGEKQPTDLNALTSEYITLAYHAIRAKDHTFEAKLTTHFRPDMGEAYVVHQEIGRVLLNLFGNAFYALRKKRLNSPPAYEPELTVSTSRLDQTFRVTIRDNGTGIPAAIQPKIFQPFFTTKPTGEGTGLGLSLSYDIITKGYGGTLTVESDEANFTEFILTLPSPA